MKKKLLLFLGLVVLSISLASPLTPTTDYVGAASECDVISIPTIKKKCIYLEACKNIQGKSETECEKLYEKSLTTTTPKTTPTLGCGDPGFIGPCFTYATADCAKQPDVINKQKCAAIKSCILDQGVNESDCTEAWRICVITYGSNTVDYANCKKYVSLNQFAKAVAPPASSGGESSCAISDGLGWIICPLIRTGAKAVDGAYAAVSSMLTIPAIDTSTDGDIFKAWSVMRNFANVAFVIAFMIIVYSQITGVGISNYGIKKMLPRVVVSAVLVNVSFWICAIAVDVSNISGSSLQGVLEGVNAQLFNSEKQIGGSVWAGIASSILATGAILYITISAFGPILIAALAAITAAVLVLTLRQALVVILIVISPLAFVAYLLPNTSSWFTKWKDLSVTLLLMFPIISIVFGGSALASTVISNAAASGEVTTDARNVLLQIMAAGVQIIPLFITPILMKVGGGLLNRWGGIVNDPAKGVFDRGRKKAEDYKTYRGNVRSGRDLSGNGLTFRGRKLTVGGRNVPSFSGGRNRRAARKDARNKAAEAGATSGAAQFGTTDATTAGYNQQAIQHQQNTSAINSANSTRYTAGVASGATTAGQGMGTAAQANREVQAALAAQQQNAVAAAIKDAKLSANIAPGDLTAMGRMMEEAIKEGDSIKARAAQDMLLTSGSGGLAQYRASMNSLEQEPDGGASLLQGDAVTQMRKNLLDNHGGTKAAANDLVQQAIKGGKMSAVSADAATWTLPDAELVHQKPASIHLAIGSGAVTKEQAIRIAGNSELNQHLDASTRTAIETIATNP